MGASDPEVFMRQFLSGEIASKDNKWQARNTTRWRNEAYDNTFRAAEGELDPVKCAALFIAMNGLVVEDPAVRLGQYVLEPEGLVPRGMTAFRMSH
jgi:peptide/nickel transport system substrate-binding protein